jgi:hypothetical protein
MLKILKNHPPLKSLDAQLLRCSGCGATTNAACNCDLPYEPAGVIAAKAVAANPNMSDSSIAKKIGVSLDTVQRARKNQVTDIGNLDRRTGADGKSYPATKQNKIQPNNEPKKLKSLLPPPSVMFGEIDEKIDELTQGIRQGRIKVDADFEKQIRSLSNGLLALLKERPQTT